MKTITLTLILMTVGLIQQCTEAAAQKSEFKPVHETIVREWIKKMPEWRIATADDYGWKPENADDYYGKDYLPHYLADHFNDDEFEDFAVMLVNRKDTKRYGLVIFNGPFKKGERAEPAFFTDVLEDGDALYMREALVVGPHYSDNIFFVRPKGSGYELKEPDTSVEGEEQ